MKEHRGLGGGYILSTGRHVDDAAGGIGIDHELQLWAGHDLALDMGEDRTPLDELWANPHLTDADKQSIADYEAANPNPPWSTAEKVELADYMIGLWTRYKEAALGIGKFANPSPAGREVT